MTRTLVISKDDPETSWFSRELGGFHKSDILLKFIAKTQPWTEEHVTTMQFIEAYDCLEQSRAGGKNFAKKFTFEKIFEECHCASVRKIERIFAKFEKISK